MATRYALKALSPAGLSPVHGADAWPLPVQRASGLWAPGRWVRVTGAIEYRRRGLHVCAPGQLGYWTRHLRAAGLTVWVVEYRGAISAGPHGWAARECRLVRPWDGAADVSGPDYPCADSYARTLRTLVARTSPRLTRAAVARVARALAPALSGSSSAARALASELSRSERSALARALRAR